MEISYTTQPENDSLLLFFAGWGTTPEVVRHLPLPEGWDYFTAYDYRSLPTTLDIRDDYHRVCLVAWSMGVWAADLLAPLLPTPTTAIAINGTPIPMHDRYGIPDDIFRATLSELTDANRKRFDRRMCGGKKLLSVYESFSARSTEDLRGELQGTYDQVAPMTHYVAPQLHWTKALISEKDLIVPPKNQQRYWHEAGIPITILEGAGHYPLYDFTSWTDLLTR